MSQSSDKVEALFAAAAALETEAQRAEYLDRACPDPELRREVESLLASHQHPDSIFEAETTRVEPLTSEAVGTIIGRYKLLEMIGEGGFGVVYMAEQTEPVRRKVALKIIKLGMDTKAVIARFEAERQALALMDHPNIAKVLDAGTTGGNADFPVGASTTAQAEARAGWKTGVTGRPYFVMELVRGVPMTRFCQENQLGIAKRLELFIQVCSAVQHAHQKGVIHRDLKPTNVLVTLNDGVPHPMLIDFGVAKAINQRLTEKTLFTNFAQMIGTPAYMSPEQAEMSKLDVDTRSDIYSLGVLLYELLTGTTPFPEERLRSAGYLEMQRIICEEKPPRPSTRLTRTAEPKPKSSLATRPSPLATDLDWIVMKCLEKDRTRRYETANGLAEDLRRHLDNEPVVARPPSKLYEFQKTIRRHRVGFAATAAIIVVLATGVLVSTWQAVRATRAQREALAARHQADVERDNEAKQKAAAQQELYDSLLGQARITRLTRHLGYRDRVFGLLQKANALDVPGKNPAELRDEAVACLGDFVGLTPATFTNFPSSIRPRSFSRPGCLAPSGKLAAFGLSDGTIQLLAMPSGKKVARLSEPGTNEVVRSWCFNSTGDQLFAVCWTLETGKPKPKNPAQVEQESLELIRQWKIYSWARDAGGRWRQSTNGALPGVVNLLTRGKEVFATIADVRPLRPDDPKRVQVKLRLFDLQTRAFVSGYEVTWTGTLNDVPLILGVGFGAALTPGGGVIALEDFTNTMISATINLYDWQTGRRINRLPLPIFGNLDLSPDGKYLVCPSAGGGSAIYTVPGLERIGQFKESAGSPEGGAAFSRNRVALPYRQNRVRIWNLLNGEDVALLDEPEDTEPVAFTADGNSLLTVGDHHARLYRLNPPEKLDLPSHAAAVSGIGFSPHGLKLASLGSDRVLRVCDATTGRILWQTNDLPVPRPCLAFSADGRWLATIDAVTEQVWIWDAHTGRRLLQFGTNAGSPKLLVAFSPHGRYVATTGSVSGTYAGTLGRIWIYRLERDNAGNGRDGLEAKLVNSSSVGGYNLEFSPDGRTLTFDKSPGGRLLEWDFATGSSQPHDLDVPALRGLQTQCFTQDGRYLMGIGRNGRVVILEMPGEKQMSSFQVETLSGRSHWGADLSPDGSRFAITSVSGRGVEIWNARTGQRLYSLPDEPEAVSALEWSPDNHRVAIARADGNIAIWNLDTVGQILTKLGLKP